MTKEELELRVEELENRYYHDELTDLPNRVKLLEDIQLIKPSGLLLLDIKGFSTINDFYGMKIGDKVLIAITSFLETLIKDDNRFYKIAADQFVYLETDEEVENHEFNEQNVRTMMTTIENTPIKVEISNDNSIDINIYTSVVLINNVSADKILELADMTLHYAKDTRQRFLEYSENLKLTEKFEKDLAGVNMVK